MGTLWAKKDVDTLWANKDVGKLWVKRDGYSMGQRGCGYTKEVCRDAMRQKGTLWDKRRR